MGKTRRDIAAQNAYSSAMGSLYVLTNKLTDTRNGTVSEAMARGIGIEAGFALQYIRDYVEHFGPDAKKEFDNAVAELYK